MFEGRASHTALYFLVEWAKQHEYEELDYGICKPFLKDGIFIYKREWGMKIKEHKDQLIYALKACNFGKGARDFLADSPIIFVDGQCLKGLVFIDKERLEVKELRHIFRAYLMPGLYSLVIISLSTTESSGVEDTLRVAAAEQCLTVKHLREKEVSYPIYSLVKLAMKMGLKICVHEVIKTR